jgi:ankyrin repeat protein/catechol 2,3-dioxygenase-like lactoylglutathione lyase family enzyme
MPLNLPERASYEFLKKLAKERLAALRAAHPDTKLASAQLAVAREYGFASWRALKAELDRRRAPNVAELMRACASGDVDALRELLARDPALSREPVAAGSTGLHLAVRHPAALRVLLEHGADPNARDAGDNASPLHFAAAQGNLDSVRVLLDAGADVHGAGDLHHGGVIGWAARKDNRRVIDLLIERGARHHIFSAMALSDRGLVERLVEEDPDCLTHRRSPFESGHTPVHAAFAPPDGLGFLAGEADYPMMQLLIELGADLEAKDDKGRTPLDVAILRGDREAARLLTAAGAAPRQPQPVADGSEQLASLAGSVKKSDPMFRVPDMRATVRWYQALGFKLLDDYEDGGELVFARLSFGACEFSLSPGAASGPRDVSLWFYTDRVEQLYQRLKERQLRAATGDGSDRDGAADVPFEEDLYVPFYGGRQFGIRDPNGLSLVFWQPDWLAVMAGNPPGR